MLDSLILSRVPHELLVVIVSALPLAELRGGIPIGIVLFHLAWYEVFILAIIGNLLPVPFLLLFFRRLMEFSRRIPIANKLTALLVKHAQRHTPSIERYERIGLIVFVGIPLPWTGAWTGAIVASMLDMKFRQSFLSISAGVLVSGVIVTTLCLMGNQIYLNA